MQILCNSFLLLSCTSCTMTHHNTRGSYIHTHALRYNSNETHPHNTELMNPTNLHAVYKGTYTLAAFVRTCRLSGGKVLWLRTFCSPLPFPSPHSIPLSCLFVFQFSVFQALKGRDKHTIYSAPKLS